MEDCGDFLSVILGLTVVMGHPETEKTEGGGLSPVSEALYADVLLTCGAWMNQYKVEAWRSIMQHYLGQALVLASGIYNMDKKNCDMVRCFFLANCAFGAFRVGTV